MSLFDDIVKTVEKSETPGLESLTATEISGISVNGDFDVDEDPMLGMAMEAMGKEVQYDADSDPEAAGYSDKDIEKLSEAGAAEEDEDDDYSEETIGELLDGYVEAVYGDPEDEDPTDLLSEEDLDDIDDDLDEGMEGVGVANAMEVNNKKDLRDAEKRISDLNNKIKSLKANCDSMESGISKLQKKSKKGDSNALKVIASLGDALVAQMNAQSEFNAEVAKLQANIDTYKSGVAKEKEDAKEAKRLEKEAKRLAKECAEVTADYSDNANEYKTLVEEQIDEVKEQQNNGEVTKDVATGVTNALGKFISKLIPPQKTMVAALAESFGMTSEDVDDIAVESYSMILRVLADTDNNADSIEILTDMITDSEEYIGTLSATESVSEAKNEAFAFYTDLLDVKASLESVVATSDEEKEDTEASKDAEISAHKKNIGILTNLLEKYGKMDSDPFYKKQKSEVEALINNEKRELAKLTGEAA